MVTIAIMRFRASRVVIFTMILGGIALQLPKPRSQILNPQALNPKLPTLNPKAKPPNKGAYIITHTVWGGGGPYCNHSIFLLITIVYSLITIASHTDTPQK